MNLTVRFSIYDSKDQQLSEKTFNAYLDFDGTILRAQWESSTPELGTIHEFDQISATLIFPNRESLHGHNFKIHIGHDPDLTGDFQEKPPSGEEFELQSVFKRKKEDGCEAPSRGTLFIGAMGRTPIFIEYSRPISPQKPKKITWNNFLCASADIQMDEQRKSVFTQTAVQLCKLASHTILSQEYGQNESIIDEQWVQGSVSLSAPPVELHEIETLLFAIIPFFKIILQNPVRNLKKTPHPRSIDRIRHWTPALLREFIQTENIYIQENRKLSEMHPIPTSDIIAHQQFKAFLIKLFQRLKRIQNICKSQIKILDTDNQNRKNENEKYYSYYIKGQRTAINNLRSIIKKTKELQKKIKAILWHPLWRNCRNVPCGLLMISSKFFAYNEIYGELYNKICIFERKHFWWYPLEETSDFTLQYTVGNGDNNRLQRKNSMLYESWCLYRMILAFERNGFNTSNYKTILRNKLAESFLIPPEDFTLPEGQLNREDLTIQIIHNVTPKSTEDSHLSQFFSPNKIFTPDYAIIISDITNPQKWFWIVLDAKSGQSLINTPSAEKYKSRRDVDYPSISCSRNGRRNVAPRESWFIYAGKPNSMPGIEGIFDSEETRKNQNLPSKGVLRCTTKDGICFDKESETHLFIGNIRANARNVPLTTNEDGVIDTAPYDPFDDFVKIQIKTAMREFGLETTDKTTPDAEPSV